MLGIAAQWLAWYIRVPSIFLLLLAVIAAFAVTNHLHDETGLFTVTVMGIVMANQRNIIVRHIIGFEETLGMLLISSLFILLSARLQLSDLAHIGWSSLAFLGMLIVIARPAAVAFSTDETYQLSPGEAVDDPALHLRGRFLFDETANYIVLSRQIEDGAAIKTTRLSDQFDYEAFQTFYQGEALLLFVISAAGHLAVHTMDTPLVPVPGQIIISLIPASILAVTNAVPDASDAGDISPQ